MMVVSEVVKKSELKELQKLAKEIAPSLRFESITELWDDKVQINYSINVYESNKLNKERESE